jgi:hypothetical protein
MACLVKIFSYDFGVLLISKLIKKSSIIGMALSA